MISSAIAKQNDAILIVTRIDQMKAHGGIAGISPPSQGSVRIQLLHSKYLTHKHPMKTIPKILTTLAICATAGTGQAALLVYESFQGSNYVVGNTFIGIEAQGTGLTGNWTKSAGSANADWTVANTANMTYSSGNVSVGTAGSKYGVGSFVGATSEVANIQLSSGLAFASQPYYVSFLIRYSGTLDLSDNFSLHTANTDSTTSITRSGVRDNTGDQAWLANNSSSSYITTPTLSSNTTYFMVLKLFNGGGDWDGTLWLNPNSTSVEGGGALGSVTASLGGTGTINYLGFKMQNGDAGDSFALDEIRIGTTWADVAVPEPTTWALLAGSLTTLVIFRRRRRN